MLRYHFASFVRNSNSRGRYAAKENKKGLTQSRRPICLPLGLQPDPFIPPLPDSPEDVDLLQDAPPQVQPGPDLSLAVSAASSSSHRSTKNVLFLGIRRPPLLRPIQDILKSASHLPYEKRVNERDEARCASSVELGYSTYRLDRKPSHSPYHVCAEPSGLRRALDINILHPNSFDEICVDFVWMPLAYLASGILSPNFFFSSLSLFAGILRYNCCIYIPANDLLVFRSIILNWTGRKVASLLKSSFYVLLDLSKPSTKSYWSGLLPPCPFTNSERTASTCSYYISASLVR
jgi:hypothetical protein